jgi:hypothetical protein
MNPSEILAAVELTDVILTAVIGSHALSELLPHAKRIKANSILQLIGNIAKAIVGTLKK